MTRWGVATEICDWICRQQDTKPPHIRNSAKAVCQGTGENTRSRTYLQKTTREDPEQNFEFKITRTDQQANIYLFAARAGENSKQYSYHGTKNTTTNAEQMDARTPE